MFPISDLLSEQEKNTTLNEKHLGSTLDDFLKEQNPPETKLEIDEPSEIEEPSNIATKSIYETDIETRIEYNNPLVVELIKKSLNIHWQQTTVLTAQAEHLQRWGYKKLAAIFKADAIQEQTHAAINIKRLEFFDADYQPLIIAPPSWARHDMVAMIKYNLASVIEASVAERTTIVAARAVGDEITANMFIELLQGSEDGIELYTGFLKLIEQMGVDNFLTLQV
jgi:bacterioferritin